MPKEKKTNKRSSKTSWIIMIMLVIVSCCHLSQVVHAGCDDEEPEIEIIICEPQITCPTQTESDLGEIEVLESSESIDFVINGWAQKETNMTEAKEKPAVENADLKNENPVKKIVNTAVK